MPRLTLTGKLFLLVCGLLYMASLTSQSGLLLVPIGIIGVCFALNFALARRAVKMVAVAAPPSQTLAEGQKLTQPWQLTNTGNKPVALVKIEAAGRTVLRLGQLAGKKTAHVVADLSFPRRGVYAYGTMQLVSSYPFGLWQIARALPLAGEMVVHPAVYPVAAPPAAGYDTMVGGKFKGRRRTQSGTHFAGVRPVQPGDGLKQIHWKSSAKGQGLMVKTFEEELSGRVSLVLDAGHNGDLATLDAACRLAASLLFAALDAGDHVEWVPLSEGELHVVAPFADGQEVLDDLARLPLSPGSLRAENLERALERISARSAITLILTDWNEATAQAVAALQQRQRVVTVYLPEKCPARPAGLAVQRYAEKQLVPEAAGGRA